MAAQGADRSLVPLRLQVTIARYENDKRTSSTPFALWMNANEPQNTRLTVGQTVPVPTTVFTAPSAGSTANVPVSSINYQNVGTTIQAQAERMPDGRFRVNLTVEDTSVAQPRAGQSVQAPTMTSLTGRHVLLLRDGQTAEFLSATDKITGEVTKIDVTVSVLK